MSASAELGLSDAESSQAQRLKLDMAKMGLPGLSEDQCFACKDVIAKLKALPQERFLAFKDGIAKLKSRRPIWRAVQERPTIKQKQKSTSSLIKALDTIQRFDRSAVKADVAIQDALAGHLEVSEWLARAKEIKALAEQLAKALHAPVGNSKRLGPVPIPPRARLIGTDLPNLCDQVFARKFSPTRTLDLEFVKACLALLGETPAKDNYIQDCAKLAGKRCREHGRGLTSNGV